MPIELVITKGVEIATYEDGSKAYYGSSEAPLSAEIRHASLSFEGKMQGGIHDN